MEKCTCLCVKTEARNTKTLILALFYMCDIEWHAYCRQSMSACHSDLRHLICLQFQSCFFFT